MPVRTRLVTFLDARLRDVRVGELLPFQDL
jgi:hypothetical protein